MPDVSTTLLPVVLADASVTVAPAAVAVALTRTTVSSPIEIIFADAVVRVHDGVDAALLRTIFQSLRT